MLKISKQCEIQEFEKLIFQFFVDYLGKNYEITDEDLEEIEESDDAFTQMVLEIYDSVRLFFLASRGWFKNILTLFRMW